MNLSMPAAESKCLVDGIRKRMRVDRSAGGRQIARGMHKRPIRENFC